MKIVIFGSREIEDMRMVEEAIEASGTASRVTEIVSGGARGVDRLEERYVHQYGLPYKIFSAQWAKYGRSAESIQECKNGGICRLCHSCMERHKPRNKSYDWADGGPRLRLETIDHLGH